MRFTRVLYCSNKMNTRVRQSCYVAIGDQYVPCTRPVPPWVLYLGSVSANVSLKMRSVTTLFVPFCILAWVPHLWHHHSVHSHRDLLSKLIPVRGNKVVLRSKIQ